MAVEALSMAHSNAFTPSHWPYMKHGAKRSTNDEITSYQRLRPSALQFPLCLMARFTSMLISLLTLQIAVRSRQPYYTVRA